jgi:GNAT superfamily N-acetyltransferase
VPGTVVRGIDGAWLEALYHADPSPHALAVWDRTVWPESVDFLTLHEAGGPTAYLLVWKGLPGCPVVHWIGRAGDPTPLLTELPDRPFLAIVPPELADLVASRGRPAVSYPLRLRERVGPPPLPDPARPTRRLVGSDTGPLRELAAFDRSAVTDTYLAVQPERDWVVGGFEGKRLVAVARAEVRLPRVWHVSGVYTHPDFRGQRWGQAVVAHLLRDAAGYGARGALFVRDDNLPARAAYDRLGFSPGTPRVWVDAGSGRRP